MVMYSFVILYSNLLIPHLTPQHISQKPPVPSLLSLTHVLSHPKLMFFFKNMHIFLFFYRKEDLIPSASKNSGISEWRLHRIKNTYRDLQSNPLEIRPFCSVLQNLHVLTKNMDSVHFPTGPPKTSTPTPPPPTPTAKTCSQQQWCGT